jgi:predicted NBD/HSP70 family sugar kinase
VLELIRTTGSVSRAEVARRSGLSKPTVSQALTGLLDSRLVREVGRESGRKGPGAVLFELNPESGWVVGLDVGRNWVRVALADITGRVVARRDERTRARSSATLVAQIGRIGHDVAADAGLKWSQVTHATVGNPGVFDPSRSQLSLAPNLPGWGKPGLVEAIRAELGTRTSFENDVNLAALGEAWAGVAQGVEDFAVLHVGTGTGVGLVLGGELHRGRHGAAGEIDLAYAGLGLDIDPCAAALEAYAERIARNHVGPTALRPPYDTPATFAAARAGDRLAAQVVAETARRIAANIVPIAAVTDVSLVVLGGGIGANGDLLLAPVRETLSGWLPYPPTVDVSSLGESAILTGALAQAVRGALDNVFSRRRPGR